MAEFLISVLYRLALRLDSFYQTAAKQLLLQPEHELNPARTRWNIIRSKIEDGSFFVLCEPLELGSEANHYRSWRHILQNVKFKEIISRAKETIITQEHSNKTDEERELQHVSRRQGLAASHIARASNNEVSSFESQIDTETLKRMSLFIKNNSEHITGL